MSWEERWRAADQGLIFSWENGRRFGEANNEIADLARTGALPVLSWKGGVDRKLQDGKPKVGSLQYLAMWQGIRGDDLQIELEAETSITCSRTGQEVIFRAGIDGLLD